MILKFLFLAGIVATANAQICCNLEQECTQYGQSCGTTTSCYWDQRFAHICEIGNGPPIDDDDFKKQIEQLKKVDEKLEGEIKDLNDKNTQVKATVTSLAGKLVGLATWKSSGNLAYKCFTKATAYDASQNECATYGGNLASKVLRDATAVEDILSSSCGKEAWIGYKKVGQYWKWNDDGATNAATAKWGPGRPDNVGLMENCGEIWKDENGKIALLNDVTCFWLRKFICEIELL